MISRCYSTRHHRQALDSISPMYANVSDTSIHVSSVRGDLPSSFVCLPERKKDLLVLRSVKTRESTQETTTTTTREKDE